MTLQTDVLSYFDENESLKSMSMDANKAFMDLLVLAVIADEEVTDEEIEQLDEELLRLPFIWDNDAREEVSSHSAATRELLEDSRDRPGVMESFIVSLAKRIQTEEHRRIAMRMFIAVAHSDGFNEQERQLVHAVGAAFEFEAGIIDHFIHEIAESL